MICSVTLEEGVYSDINTFMKQKNISFCTLTQTEYITFVSISMKIM